MTELGRCIEEKTQISCGRVGGESKRRDGNRDKEPVVAIGRCLMQMELPSFDKVPKLAKKRVKAFDPGAFGMTKARRGHVCHKCSRAIEPGETYYQEGKGRFLGTLHGRKLCRDCYDALAPSAESSAAG